MKLFPCTLWWSANCWSNPIQMWNNPALKIMKDVNRGKTQAPVSPQQGIKTVVIGLTPKWFTFCVLSDDINAHCWWHSIQINFMALKSTLFMVYQKNGCNSITCTYLLNRNGSGDGIYGIHHSLDWTIALDYWPNFLPLKIIFMPCNITSTIATWAIHYTSL